MSVDEPLSRFRPHYRALSEAEKIRLAELKEAYALIEAMLDKLPPGRYRALALTALEASCMWAVKELTGGSDNAPAKTGTVESL